MAQTKERKGSGGRERQTPGKEFKPDWHYQEPVDWRDTDIDEKVLKEWYYWMLLGRQIDYRCQVLNRQGRAPFIISCAGHEAAQIGVAWPLKPKYDWISPYYRDVVLCFRMGLTALDLMLSVLAKPADPASGGKQTPGHFSDTRLNIISGGSPLSTQMVHGAGAAYALRMDGTDKVLMTCYGEGAGSEGDTHEAFNFAAIYKLPEIFVCQNNGFAISVPFSKEYAIQHAAQRAAGYGFPGVTVDGRDPVTCYHVSKQAVARARAGDGPTLIETLVDRLGAHSSEDDQRRYRTQEELDALTQNDCLVRFQSQLLAEKIIDKALAGFGSARCRVLDCMRAGLHLLPAGCQHVSRCGSVTTTSRPLLTANLSASSAVGHQWPHARLSSRNASRGVMAMPRMRFTTTAAM